MLWSHTFLPKFCVVAVIDTLLYSPGRYGWANMSHTCVLGSGHLVNVGDLLPITLSSEGKSPEAGAKQDELYWPEHLKSASHSFETTSD